jgi:hypothetical protein
MNVSARSLVPPIAVAHAICALHRSGSRETVVRGVALILLVATVTEKEIVRVIERVGLGETKKSGGACVATQVRRALVLERIATLFR